MSQPLQNDVRVKIEDYFDQIWSSDGILSSSTGSVTQMELSNLIYEYMVIPPEPSMENWMDKAGANLYHHIESFFQNKVNNIYQNVNDMADNDIVRFYAIHWHNYKRICDIVSALYVNVSQHWIQVQLNNSRSDIYEINVLCQLIWEKIFFKPLFPHITQICVRLITMDLNNHSSVDVQSIKNILHLYTDKIFSEMIKTDPKFQSINDIYTEYFETEFLQEVENFYRRQELPSFEPNQMLEYLTSIAQYFDIQIDLAKSYLPEQRSTSKKLIDIVEKIFISDDTQNIILEKIKSLVWDQDKHEELARVYEPISRIPKIKNQLITFIEDYIHEMGINAIRRVSETAIDDPKVYIEIILDIYKKFLKFVQEIFNGEQEFTGALDKACLKFINDNAVIQKARRLTESSELLARYCDTLLRKESKTVEETDLEEKLNEIMIVFNYIKDKDVFRRFYGIMLSYRLIGQLSVSDDYEGLMISKLKEICGSEYTSKLEQKFQDISVSRTLTVKYEDYCKNHHVTGLVDFSVLVLTLNSWPFSVPSNIVLPIELKPTFDNFIKFYTHHHIGRELIWLHQYSNAELQTSFTSHKYTLQVSTYQMVVLLLFNKSLSWTVEQIQDETQIESKLLFQILCSLLQSKILVCAEISEDFKEVDIKMNSTIKLANDFTSNKFRINLNVSLKSIEQESINDLHKSIDANYKIITENTIVRIMCCRRRLSFRLLIQEVIEQLSSRFKPTIPLIKKCIDILIEKEYLERDSQDKDLLHYTP